MDRLVRPSSSSSPVLLLFCIVSLVFLNNVEAHVVQRESASLDISRRESVHVRLVPIVFRRFKRASSSSPLDSGGGEVLEIRRPNTNSTIQVHLSPRDEIMSPDFIFTVHDGSNRSLIPELSGQGDGGQEEDCFFSGTVQELNDNDESEEKAKNLGKVALSACGGTPGFSGVIKTTDGDFVLEPEELQWPKVVGVSVPTSDTDRDRLETPMTKSGDDDDVETSYTLTPLINLDDSQSDAAAPHACQLQESQPNNSGDESEDNFEIRPESPLNVEEDNEQDPQIISTYAAGGRRWKNNGSGKGGGDGGNGVIHDPKSDGRPVIELALFADSAFVNTATKQVQGSSLKNLKNYMVNLVHTVAIQFDDDSLDIPVTVELVSIEIFKQDPANLNTGNGDIGIYLTSWCAYQNSLNPNGDKWDHAMILTGLDIGNRESKSTVGYAKLSGMCTNRISCSIVETTSFFSAIAMTHEVGHALGMNHDGEGVNSGCSLTTHIMAASLSEKQTATWSSCSNENMKRFLATSLKSRVGYTKCLLKPGNGGSKKKKKSINFGGKLPGQQISGHEQCKMKFGNASPYPVLLSTDFAIQNFDFCKAMYCKGVNRKPVQGDLAYYAHPPLEGTDCASEKCCRRGQCVSKS